MCCPVPADSFRSQLASLTARFSHASHHAENLNPPTTTPSSSSSKKLTARFARVFLKAPLLRSRIASLTARFAHGQLRSRPASLTARFALSTLRSRLASLKPLKKRVDHRHCCRRLCTSPRKFRYVAFVLRIFFLHLRLSPLIPVHHPVRQLSPEDRLLNRRQSASCMSFLTLCCC